MTSSLTNHILLLTGLVVLLAVGHAPLAAMDHGPVSIAPPDAERVRAIADMLGEGPIVASYGDEGYWRRAAEIGYLRDHIGRAEQALDRPFVDLEEFDRTYRRFLDDGNRKEFEHLVNPSRESIRLYALAECIERKGRFLVPLSQRIEAVCGWPTWFMSAHDPKRDNLEGRTVQIDLGVAMKAADIATCLLVFGDRLDPEIVELAQAELRRRVLEPYRRELRGKQKPMWWLRNTNNWTAVCHTGVVLAALAAAEDAEQTAWYLAGAERMIGNFLAGFTADGYCSEGIGYWGYGYGHYIVLSEYIRRATGGGVDLFLRPASLQAARFPLGIQLVDGVYPAFADAMVDARPTQPWSWYVAKRLGVEDPGVGTQPHPCAGGFGLYGRLPFIAGEEVTDADATAATTSAPRDPRRDSFPQGGVYVMRAHEGEPFAVAIKAGHNGEHHNHNDVGSWTLATRGRPLLCDPGKEVYTRFTFSRKHRYQSPVHNSYGHPVPVVAGQLQGTGQRYCGEVLAFETTPVVDRISIDLRGAYDVEGLERLQRELVFDRRSRTVTIVDTVAFVEPQEYGTALVTYGAVDRSDDGLRISAGEAAVSVHVSGDGADLQIEEEILQAEWHRSGRLPVLDGRDQPRRIGISCTSPVREASITTTITVP